MPVSDQPLPVAQRARRWIPALALVAACGSRSPLGLGSAGASGSGGTPLDAGLGGSAALGGTGAIGGAGGAGGVAGTSAGAGGLPHCAELVRVDPVLTIASEPGVEFDDYLRFTASSDDGEQITGAFARQLQGGETVVHHATLAPWKSWPTSEVLGPVHSTFLGSWGLHVPTRAPGGRWAMAARLFDGPVFVRSIDPKAPGIGPETPTVLGGIDAELAVARAPGVGEPMFLVGTFDPGNAILGHVIDGDGQVLATSVLGCATGQPLRASGVPYADGWLVAVSTGKPFGGCLDPSLPGPPTRIDVLRVGPDGSVTEVASLDVGSVVVEVLGASHPQGMFVVSKSAAASGGLTAARVDVPASSVVGPAAVTGPSELPMAYAVTSLGPRLAVARRSDPGGDPKELVLSVHDESLVQLAVATDQPEPFWGVTSAIGAPNGASVVLGWTLTGETPWRVQLARWDCWP